MQALGDLAAVLNACSTKFTLPSGYRCASCIKVITPVDASISTVTLEYQYPNGCTLPKSILGSWTRNTEPVGYIIWSTTVTLSADIVSKVGLSALTDHTYRLTMLYIGVLSPPASVYTVALPSAV